MCICWRTDWRVCLNTSSIQISKCGWPFQSLPWQQLAVGPHLHKSLPVGRKAEFLQACRFMQKTNMRWRKLQYFLCLLVVTPPDKHHSHLPLPWWRRHPASFVSTGRRDMFFCHFAPHNKCNAVDKRILHNLSNFITIISDWLKPIKEFILKVPSHFTAGELGQGHLSVCQGHRGISVAQPDAQSFRPMSLLQNYYSLWSHREFAYFRTSKRLWKLTRSCQHASASSEGLGLLPPLCLSAETCDRYGCYWQLQ